MAENPKRDLRELTRQIALSSPSSDDGTLSPVPPVSVSPVENTALTDVDFYQQFLAAGVVPENRSQVWLPGSAVYLQHESLFVLDERGLPRPQVLKKLGVLSCGCALDKGNRFAGICPFDELEVCSAHWVPSCGICSLPGCLFGTRPYWEHRVHRWHLGPAHPLRVISSALWKRKLRNSN